MADFVRNKRFFSKFFYLGFISLIFLYPLITAANAQTLYNQPFLTQIQAFKPQTQDAGNQVIVAVIDEGVYINHPDLAANIWDGYNGYRGWNFLNDSADLSPTGSHGTQVAGVIKAVTQGANVRLMPLIACDGTGGCNIAAINRAIYYAVDHGAGVINLSLGLVAFNSYTDDFNAAIAYAYQHGVVIVAAAGNGESNGGVGQNLNLQPVSPVCNDNGQDMVLGVSAADGLGQFAPWSNFGDCVDVVAPGAEIYTAADPQFDNQLLYGYVSGSSFSAAEVSGLAALLKLQSPALTNRQIMDAIEQASSPQSYRGLANFGIIDVKKTLAASANPAEKVPAHNPAVKQPARTLNAPIKNRVPASPKNAALAPSIIHPRGL